MTSHPSSRRFPLATLENLVRQEMRKEAALKQVYGAEVTPTLLDAEGRRINTSTRAPEVLAEIKAALGNGPARFAHAMAKPILVERLLREKFDNDDALHAPRRPQVELLRTQLLRLKNVLRVQLQKATDVSAMIETPTGFLLYVTQERTEAALSVAGLALPKRSYEQRLENSTKVKPRNHHWKIKERDSGVTWVRRREWSGAVGANIRWLCAVMVFLCTFCAHAHNFAIDWFKISGGGGTSTGGVFSVSGTIGQPDTGKSAGGSYELEAGFWSVYAAVQTPGAPFLKVKRVGNTVEISWSTTATAGFVLQETGGLTSPISWSGVVTTPTVVSNENVVTVTATTGFHFYRLRKP